MPPAQAPPTAPGRDGDRDAHHDAPMPWSVFFSPGIAFHTGSLSQCSHGCVHLSNATAKTFFSTLYRGDTVVVVR